MILFGHSLVLGLTWLQFTRPRGEVKPCALARVRLIESGMVSRYGRAVESGCLGSNPTCAVDQQCLQRPPLEMVLLIVSPSWGSRKD